MKTMVKDANIFETKIIKGDIFIIPNQVSAFKDSNDNPWDKCFKEKMEEFGIKPEPGDKLVQVWVCNPDNTKDNSNWTSHPGEFNRDNGLSEKEGLWLVPEYWPAGIFAGKKEGDIITLPTLRKNFKLELRLAQKDYRYRNFGNFEEVFDHLTK